MKKYIAILIALAFAVVGVFSFAAPAQAAPGDSASDPIVVASPSEVPAGAVEDEVSTYVTDAKCDTTRSWVLTVPATEDTTHQEFRYKRDVPAVEEVSHNEWRSIERTREVIPGQHHDAVTHTEYHFKKFTHTKTRTYVEGTEAVNHWWNWSPNNTQGPQDYVPNFPTDPRGTWQGPHVNGGPQQDTFGTFQTGGGNSPFFHREHISDATAGGWGPWSDFGPWTPWVPTTHESWELSDAPLGVPQFHGSGQDGNTQWYREWQAQFDGTTRTVTDEEAYDDPDTLGPWSEWTEFGPVSLTEPVLPANTETHEYDFTGPVKVVDTAAQEGYTEYYVLGGEPSRDEADASWVLAEQAPEGWTQFDERTVTDAEGTPEVVTYYAFSDNVKCDKPEEPPVTPNPPKHNNPPKAPDTPVTPVLPNAGMDDEGSNMSLPLGAALMLILAGGGLLAVRKRA